MLSKLQRHVKVKSPGKLFLAGEYSVVSANQPALVFAVDAFIEIEALNDGKREIINNDGSIEHWEIDAHKNVIIPGDNDNNLALTAEAMTVTLNYLCQISDWELEDFDFSIIIRSDLENSEGKKYGYGSSGAATVAPCQAILKLFSYDQNLDFTDFALLSYKLSALAQTRLGKLGSFGDLAACCLSGLILYQNFQREILGVEDIYDIEKIQDLLTKDWPGLKLQALSLPEEWKIVVMWSQQTSSTEDLLKKINHKSLSSREITDFLSSSKEQVLALAEAICNKDWEAFKNFLSANAENIQNYLSKQNRPYNLPIFEKAEAIAKKFGACFKISGSGAGDCAVAITKDEFQARALADAWANAGIRVLKHKIWQNPEIY